MKFIRAYVGGVAFFVCLVLSLSGCGGGGGGGSEPAVTPPVESVGRVLSETINSSKTGTSYVIQIYLPASYDAGSASYPVVYALDGDAAFVPPDTRFTHFKEILQKRGTNAILVGIGGTLQRQTDYNFPGAYAYHDFLSLELIPSIESQFRADPAKRILSGLSTSGNLAMTALFIEAPNHLLFSYFLSTEAAFWQQQDEDYDLEQQMFNAVGRAALPVTVILAKGDPDVGASNAVYVQAMYDRLAGRKYTGMQLLLTTFPDAHVETDDPAFEDAISRIVG